MKSKYHAGLDQIVYETIASSGSDVNAIEVLGVDETTFYKWIAAHPSFREAITKARDFHRKCSPEVQKMMLLKYMIGVLDAGYHTATYKTKTTSRLIRKDARKRILYTDEVESVVEHTSLSPIQKWIADKVMPNAGDLEDAIKKVLSAGLRVSDPSLAPVATTGNRVLTDADIEAINTVKENLLFGVQS